jgi:acyl carrier protein
MMHLAGRLPDFMLPSQIIVLGTMPLTPNGKLDRRALPVPVAASEQGPVVAAENETEAAVAEIWRDSLGLTKISMVSNFFDLGGHSLLVVQVQRRMKERFKRDIAITDIFRFPTVRAIAAHLSNEHQNAPNAAHRGLARAAARLARMERR